MELLETNWSFFSATGIAKSVVSSQGLRQGAQISIANKITANQTAPTPPLKKSAILTTASSVGGRGNPPPIPPNKPVIPVKRDQNSRIPFATGSPVAAGATNAKGSCDFEDVSQTPMFSSNITK